MKNYLIIKLLCSVALLAMPIVMIHGQEEILKTKVVGIGAFSVEGNDSIVREQAEIPNIKDGVFDVVEQMPEFPGGIDGLMEYLNKNVKYPIVAQMDGIQGRVVVSFVVERDGSITDVQVVKSVDPSLDREAVRVISSMPNWLPGMQGGKPVRVKYNIPVSFRLDADDEKPYERYYRLSNQYANKGDLAQAVYYSDKALSLCSDDSDDVTLLEYAIQNVYAHLALWETQECTEVQTRELLERIDAVEQDVEALLNAMSAARGTEEIDEAIAAINTLSVHLISWQGQLKYFLGDITGAIDDFTKGIDSNSEDVGIQSGLYIDRGYCYKKLGQKKLAEKDYKEVIKIEDSPEKYHNANFAYLALGNTKKAIAITDDILSRSTTPSDDYYAAATLYALIGNNDKALEYLEKAFEEGYTHFGWIHWDDQLDAIRETPEFKALLNKYEERYKDKLITIGTK